MKKLQIIAILLLSVFVFSCNEKSKPTPSTAKVDTLDPEVNISEINADFEKWWSYYSNTISLSSDFTGLTEQSDTIDKKQFLEQLITGNYIPLKIKSDDNKEIYKLYKLDADAAERIRSIIISESVSVYGLYVLEGSPLPAFNFTDLNGNTYTSENTKGKTIVLKTWFINCAACIAEIPELNEFVEKYNERDDVIFLSLALDSKPELEAFLKQKEFNYKVVPDQKEYILGKLYLNLFPTHLVVDENGIVLEVLNKSSDVIAFLENGMKSIDKKLPTPSSSSVAPPPPPPPPPPM